MSGGHGESEGYAMRTRTLTALIAAALVLISCGLVATDFLHGPGDAFAHAEETGASEDAQETTAATPDTVDSDAGARKTDRPDSVRAAPRTDGELVVMRAYICKGIEESEPTEAGKSFIPEEGGVWRLCCFSEIGGAVAADTIAHIWYWGERRMATVPLPVGPARRWRTWSTKKILDEWRGEWRVDIVDPDGEILETLGFSVE